MLFHILFFDKLWKRWSTGKSKGPFLLGISKLFDMTVVQLLNTHGAEDQDVYNVEVNTLTHKLREREVEIIDLQKKVIELYEVR